MIVDTPQARLPILPGQVIRLDLLAGSRLRALAGSAWVTMDGDPRDFVLAGEEELRLDADHRVLVCALRADGRAELRVCDPPAAGVQA